MFYQHWLSGGPGGCSEQAALFGFVKCIWRVEFFKKSINFVFFPVMKVVQIRFCFY